jgi:hypothetical protein
MRRTLVAAIAATLAFVVLTSAAEARSLPQKYTDVRAATKKVCGSCVGRNIRAQGLRFQRHGRWVIHVARVRDYHRTIAQMERLKAPPPAPTVTIKAGPPAQPPAGVQTAHQVSNGGSSNPMVNPSCESGGNPQVVSPSGQYWGKYQFDEGTWIAHGGSPDSYGNASEAEQDVVASHVHYDAWPNC